MKLIHPDHERPYHLPGVPTPAHRPVDIDAATTCFQRLRSLRIYRFAAGTPVDGHAEEDEVFLVVTVGTATVQIGSSEAQPADGGTVTLSAFHAYDGKPSVIYLPPHSVYRLTPHTVTDVAYARATPTEHRSSSVFTVTRPSERKGDITLLHVGEHAQHLRLRLGQIETEDEGIHVDLRNGVPLAAEALIHTQSGNPPDSAWLGTAGSDSLPFHSWDTAALAPGDSATLQVPPHTCLLTLTVYAE